MNSIVFLGHIHKDVEVLLNSTFQLAMNHHWQHPNPVLQQHQCLRYIFVGKVVQRFEEIEVPVSSHLQ